MEKLIESFKDTLIERLKNPIVSTFIIAWCFSNIKILFNLFSLSGDERVNFVNSLTFDIYTDIAYPILVSVMYLYIIPTYNYFHQKIFYLKLSEKRFLNQKDHMVKYYYSQENVNKAKVKSQEAYLIKKFDKELDSWEQQKIDLNKEIENLKCEVINKEKELIDLDTQIKDLNKEHETELNKLAKTYKDQQNIINNIHSELTFISGNLTSYVEMIKDKSENDINNTNLIKNVSDAIKNDSKRIDVILSNFSK